MEKKIDIYTSSINYEKILIDFILFIILPPIIGLPFIIFKTIQLKDKARYSDYLSFMICIAFYFGAINATKNPEGDQINYYVAYLNVPTQGFIGSLINIYGVLNPWEEARTRISGEFMNGVYNYFGYYLTFGYYPLFACLLTIANYILNFLGIYNFSKSLKKPHFPIIYGILILSFFYFYFQFLLQIQKQFLAQSIITYVLSSFAIKGKLGQKEYIMTAMAIFTHAATMLFVPFLFFRPLREKLNKKSLILLSIIFSIFIIIGPSIAGNIVSNLDENSSSTLTYGINRFANSEIHNDTEFGLVWSQIFVIAVPMMIIVLNKIWRKRNSLIKEHAFILNIILLLLLTIVAMYKQPTAQYRYFIMLIAFMPYTYFFITENLIKRDLCLKYISIIMIIWFYYQFDKIVWTYAPEIDIILKSPIILLFNN